MGGRHSRGGVAWRARDMAKFGQLFLDDGHWQGQQIISEDWVARSVTAAVNLSGDFTSGYGYQWWLGDFRVAGRDYPFYSAQGYGGQYIVVIEALELVIAVFARNYRNGLGTLPLELIEAEIIPAVLDG